MAIGNKEVIPGHNSSHPKGNVENKWAGQYACSSPLIAKEVSGVDVQISVTAGIWWDHSVKELQVSYSKEVLLKSWVYL